MENRQHTKIWIYRNSAMINTSLKYMSGLYPKALIQFKSVIHLLTFSG